MTYVMRNQQTSGLTGKVLRDDHCTHTTGRGDVSSVVHCDIQVAESQISWSSMSRSNAQEEILVRWRFTVAAGLSIPLFYECKSGASSGLVLVLVQSQFNL